MIQQNSDTAVVILNWNGINWLQKFIPILLKNTDSSEADIVVADNASSDDSVSFLEQNYQEVQLILLDQNYGFAEGYNKAINQIHHPYTVLLNSDVEVGQNWLRPLVKKLSESEQNAACQPKILDYKNRHKFEYAGACGGYIDYLGYPYCRGRIFNSLEEDKGQYDTVESIFWASGACLAIRTEKYKEVGGLDGLFFAHMEEIDLCWRLKNRDYQIFSVPESLVYHVGGGTLSKISSFKTYLNFRNNLLILYKNLPKGKLFKIMLHRIVLDTVAGVKFIFDGQFNHFLSVLKAHLHFYSMLSKFRDKRAFNRSCTTVNTIPEIYQKSIVFQHFVKGIKRFSDLGQKKN